MSSAIPLVDARALAPHARRTLAVRTALMLAAAGAVAAFLLLSRDPGTRTIVPLAASGDTIITIDLSASINYDAYTRIGATLASLEAGGGRFGLVLFSDEAYEALPPGTPARDLAPFVRYFRPVQRGASGVEAPLPSNPWQSTFAGGTRIAAGLQLAHGLATAGRGGGRVTLLSDLDDSEPDRAGLASVLLSYKRDNVPLQVLGLDPSSSDVAYFQRLLGAGVTVTRPPRPAEVRPRSRTPFPWSLVALTLATATALAAGQLWGPRLEWGR
jgi:hypothetical protein